MSDVESELAKLAETVDSLSSRLQSVLRPDEKPAGTGTEPVTSFQSSLACKIQSHALKARNIEHQIGDLLRLLEL